MSQLRILSLGAGVQSTVVALMSARRDLPMFDAAIFCDTGWEPKAVYRHLDWLEAQLPFPVHRVSAGNIRADAMAGRNTTGGSFSAIPWFTLNKRGEPGMGRRQCTKEYKLRPLQRKIVELLGGRPKGGAVVSVGISREEAWRMKPSRVGYIVNEWPLIAIGMRRYDCLMWLMERQYPKPPKSACIGCPFHDADGWRALTAEEFADAVVVDRAIRNPAGKSTQQFMHPSREPLEHVDLSTSAVADMFNMECEGMCGL